MDIALEPVALVSHRRSLTVSKPIAGLPPLQHLGQLIRIICQPAGPRLARMKSHGMPSAHGHPEDASIGILYCNICF